MSFYFVVSGGEITIGSLSKSIRLAMLQLSWLRNIAVARQNSTLSNAKYK